MRGRPLDHTKMHRRLKWLWIVAGIPATYVLKDSVTWVSIMSVYAIIVAHWASEEAAD